MKNGVITDIHNNVAALNAVREEFTKVGIEGVICCGDIIGIGPRPEETVQAIMAMPNKLGCVRGNFGIFLWSGIKLTDG